jgi:hypothetical protein
MIKAQGGIFGSVAGSEAFLTSLEPVLGQNVTPLPKRAAS